MWKYSALHAGNDYNELACTVMIVSVYGCIVGREEVTAQWCVEVLCTRNDHSAVNCYNWLLGTTAMLVTLYLHTQIANIVIVSIQETCNRMCDVSKVAWE